MHLSIPESKATNETLTQARRALPILARILCTLAVLLLALRRGGAHAVAAQWSPVDWSRPLNLSNSPPSSRHPAIVADALGYVHVFWSEDIGGEIVQPEDTGGTGNSIVYTCWDGTSWTRPVDVLIVPEEQIAEFVAVDVDVENRLHAVWTGQWNLYYSQAPAWQASSAHAWSAPVVVAADSARTMWESDILAASQGNLHIVYATRGDEVGVYHIRSQDGGHTWSLATRLSTPFDPLEASFSNVKIIEDGAGYLHAIWQTNQDDGFGQAIYYARSTDEGESWSLSVRFGYRDPGDYEASWPYIAAKGESELHLIYVDGARKGRNHRVSTDNGQTWSEPRRVIAEMEGVNGYVIPLVDGSGQIHLIVNMRTVVGQVVGIYYARWLGTDWSLVEPVDVSSSAAPSAHRTAAAVRLGNELHVVYNQFDGAEIWHIRGTLAGIEPAPALALPQIPLQPTLTPVIAALTPKPTTAQTQPSTELAKALSATTSRTVDTFLPGLGASLLLVIAVIVWTRVRPQ